ncbi:related to endoglucanase [Armillaria ostoyae]|uniref:Related to endoglucanase n=1 Tax=Armillaria ostoyae TaxID=47428 RepID=A0A284RB30_ARMOS|nr:related to endoglucanase [Armillaria ostoyae]
MCKIKILLSLLSIPFSAVAQYTWKNVKIGGGGGFVPGIVFNPSEEGLAYVRTDIGGAYRLNDDDTWTPLTDWVDNDQWNMWGVDALATDPVETNRLYLATGMYTNSWDPGNGHILVSEDYGESFTQVDLPFKCTDGWDSGERLAVDPNSNNILFFGARSGNGLYKSTDYGTTWTQVSSLPDVGTYVVDATDTSGYNSDPLGIAFVTFDSTSGSSGSPTPRIFVGVASNGTDNIFVSEDAGDTWTAIAGQQQTYFPHKGVLSPEEGLLYVSYSDGTGPYDGTLGAVHKYDIANATWTDITPVSGSDLSFGFGGLSVDVKNPGTLMVAALNLWWPDGQIYRSTDSGATWSTFWTWGSYPAINKYYSYSDSLAPWLGVDYVDTTLGDKQIGWMMEALSIDPFDSDHFLYGTGATIYGSRDLTLWDSVHNISLSSMADGIEETAVQALISPPGGPSLISGVSDIQGFVHTNLGTPTTSFSSPVWTSVVDLDYAGNVPTNIIRLGNGDSSTGKQVAISTDSGTTWSQDTGAPDNVSGGKIAISADGDTVLWRTSSNDVLVSQNTSAFTPVSTLPTSAVIASDKTDNSVFYGASSSSFYVSNDTGSTFSAVSTLGNSTSPVKIVVNPDIAGDVWVSTDVGLFHSTDYGSTFMAIESVSQAWAIALGVAATDGGYPAVFAAANIGSGVGYYRSDDEGATWTQINDSSLGFGSVSANVMAADPRVYGRVYIGTNGRGIFYGDVSSTSSTPTSSAVGPSSSAAVSTSAAAASSAVTSSIQASPSATTASSSENINGSGSQRL